MSTTSTGSSSPRSGRAPGGVAIPHDAASVRATLARLGVRPSRSRGQSFLVDPFVADAEAALVGPVGPRGVLEVGGGLGILTEALQRRSVGPLTVVESDPRLAAFLEQALPEWVQVVVGDARSCELPPVDVVVGNLPYSAATPILLRLFARRVPRVVAIVQAEVAARLAAEPGTGDYGRLTLAARLYGSVERFRTIPPESFEPPPEVTSQILVHTAREGPLPVPSVPIFEEVVRRLFSTRRKQLGNLLPAIAGSRLAADRLARAAGWPDGWRILRPERLPPDSFFALATVLTESGRAEGAVRPPVHARPAPDPSAP